MSRAFGRLFFSVTAGLALLACGGGGGAPAEGDGDGQAAMADEDEARSRVCSLLTDDQVSILVPGHTGPSDEDTSEASLLEDVTLEHCQYYAVEGTDLQLLNILIWQAGSEEAFDQIKIGEWAHEGTDQRLDFGEIAYLVDGGLTWSVKASKGLMVLEVSLTADDAATKSEQLVELARVVAAKLWN